MGIFVAGNFKNKYLEGLILLTPRPECVAAFPALTTWDRERTQFAFIGGHR
jgi:hypothetical protein